MTYLYIYVYILIIQEILLKFSLWGFAIFSEGNMVAKKKILFLMFLFMLIMHAKCFKNHMNENSRAEYLAFLR